MTCIITIIWLPGLVMYRRTSLPSVPDSTAHRARLGKGRNVRSSAIGMWVGGVLITRLLMSNLLAY